MVFIMVILGGLGSLPGAIIGAVAFTVPPFLLQQFVFYKYLIISVVLIAVMLFRPDGVLGAVSIRPRKTLGAILELLAAETAVSTSALPAVSDVEAAHV